ncbi:MAG: STAS domain-containing protein [Treponema sp.]|nr:STAS domain-containing protein [Treponema sp.]
MEITVNKTSDSTVFEVTGRLDTSTAPSLEAKTKEYFTKTKLMVLDFKNLEYISSAGIRVVLQAHKGMGAYGGKLVIKSPSDFCQQVFEATGMDSILSIEK